MNLEIMKKKIDDYINQNYYPNRDGGIEEYVDYRDELSDYMIKEIVLSDNPRMTFEAILEDWEIESSSMSDLINNFINTLSLTEKAFWNINEAEIEDYIFNKYYFYYNSNHFDKEIKVNLMVDVGNANYDFCCDNVLNYYSNRDGEFDEYSSMLWLAKQQGKENDLKEAVKKIYRKDGFYLNREIQNDQFIESCIQELENLPTHMSTLTFLLKMNLFEYFNLREAIDLEKPLNDFYDVKKRKGNGYLIISKDTECGLFDSWNGSGSVLEIESDKDVILPIKYIYDACVDGAKTRGYDVNEVYGLIDGCWKRGLKEIIKNNYTKEGTK